MFSRFTEKAIQVIIHAQDSAKKFGNDFLGTEHLLLALLQVNKDESLVKRALKESGVDQQGLIKAVEDVLLADSHTAVPDNVPFTAQVKKVLSFAWDEARQLGHSSVDAEHLFLALLKEQNGIAMKIIHKFDVPVLKLRNSVISLMGEELVTPITGHKQLPADTPMLNEFCRDLTWLASENKLDPVIGRAREIERVVQILSRRTKNNPVLTGEAGVGKTAIVEGLAQRIIGEEVPKTLLRKRVVTLDLGLLVAGTKYRGEFEERMKKLLAEVRTVGNIIMFVDELHTIVGTGSTEGSLDVANMFKPAMARGEIQIIGATTLNEYRKFIEADSALERRFQSILVDPPNMEQTLEILKGIIGRYEEFHEVKFMPDALIAAVTLSARYISDRQFPDKAIDLIDEAASRVIIKGKKSKVTESDIAEIIALWKGIDISSVTRTEADRLLNMATELKSQVIGQDEAIEAISKAIKRSKAGLKDPKRPVGSFIFLGPSGVGKTELAKRLAAFLFGDENNIVRIDMSEYTEKHTVSRLIGSPPGYVGHDEGGQLTEPVRRKPYSIVLFDEIEKGASEVHNLLLQLMEDGILTDSVGRKVDFKNTIIIMTSNVGSNLIRKESSFGFVNKEDKSKNVYEKLKESVLSELKKAFSPEFLNRIDDTIIFKILDKVHMKEIALLMLAELTKRLESQAVSLVLNDSALNFIVDKGYVENQGARPLRHTIQDLVENSLADKMLAGDLKPGSVVEGVVNDDKIDFVVKAGAKPKKNNKGRGKKELVSA